jgi:hypothetical protein
MSESTFAAEATRFLLACHAPTLRICDGTDGRHRRFGLKFVGLPKTHAANRSTGPDYLVAPSGMRVVVARSMADVRAAYELAQGEAFFLELKDPERRLSDRSPNQDAQDAWIELMRRRMQ